MVEQHLEKKKQKICAYMCLNLVLSLKYLQYISPNIKAFPVLSVYRSAVCNLIFSCESIVVISQLARWKSHVIDSGKWAHKQNKREVVALSDGSFAFMSTRFSVHINT